MYVVRKIRNQDHYSVKSKHCPIIVYLKDKSQALRLAEKLNESMPSGEEGKFKEENPL
jgi:hypothetical protein